MTRRQRDAQSYLTSLCCAIPYHIVESVLADPREEALANRTVTGSVLVVDLVGFSGLCERRAARGPAGLAELSQLLDGFFEWLALEAIFPYRGYILQFAGDAITVAFEGQDHVRRCAACALTIQKATREGRGSAMLGSSSSELMVRMAVGTGRIHLLVLGDLTCRLAACTGGAIHRVIQLQQHAEPGEVRVAPGFWDQLPDELEVHHDSGGRERLAGLKTWPPRGPIEPLEGRVEQDIEKKIKLLEPFVPEPMAKRIRSSLEGWRLQGEIRRVAIVFVDIWGFGEGGVNLTLAQEVVRSGLRSFRKYDGVVFNVAATDLGHRGLVVYGLKNPSENDAERALLASLEVVARLRSMISGDEESLTLRIGVHAGDVYLGCVGSALKHSLTVLGNVVTQAARVTESVGRFEVVATSAALDGLEGKFRASPRAPMEFEGGGAPLRTFVVHGATEGRSHYFQRRQRQRFLGGRGEAVARLNAIVDEALAGRGRAIGITGEAGTGKSALLSGVVDRWIGGGGVGVVGRCRLATRTTPLAPVVDMFATYFGFTDGDTDARRADRIREGLGEMDLGGGLQELLAVIQPVRRPDALSEANVDLTDVHLQQRVQDALVTFIRQRVRQRKVLYVLEDLHLADSVTLQAARRVLAIPRDGAFLIAATYRPDDVLTEIRHQLDEEVVLASLDRAATADLLCHELAADHIDPALADFLWGRTCGNPNWVVQIAHFLSDRLLIRVHKGVLMAAEPGVQLLEGVVPSSWAHVALARFEGLGEVERRILKAASVIGRQFDAGILEQVFGQPRERELLDTAMSALESEYIIATEGVDPGQYRFRDEVTRAIAYSMIPEPERALLHRQIADTLEPEARRNERTFAATMGHHRERAGQHAEAARWYGRVVHTAAAASMYREVCFFAKRWTQAVEQTAEASRPPRDEAARVLAARVIATARQGQYRQALALARELLRGAPGGAERLLALLDPATRATVRMVVAEGLTAVGELDRALERLGAVHADTATDAAHRFAAACDAATICLRQGDLPRASGWLDRAGSLAGQHETRWLRLQLVRGAYYEEQSQLENAQSAIESAMQHAERDCRPGGRGSPARAVCLRRLGLLAILGGSLDRARHLLDEALAIDRGAGDLEGEALDLCGLGRAEFLDREFKTAQTHLDAALRIAQESGLALVRAEALVYLGAAVAFTEDPPRGERLAEEGRALAHAMGLGRLTAEADAVLLHVARVQRDAPRVARCRARARETKGWLVSPLYRRLVDEE